MNAEDRGARDARASGAPGWRSIDAALASLYGGQEPARFGTAIRHALGGPDPLDGISAYRRTAPVPATVPPGRNSPIAPPGRSGRVLTE